MMRTLTGLTVALVLGLASAATAITVVVDTDKTTYMVGESIIVTTTMTVTGAECPAVADGTCAGILLQLTWDDAKIADDPVGPAAYGPGLTSGGGMFTWSIGAGFCLADSCLVIDQLSPLLPNGSQPDATVHVGTLSLIADALGLINFQFGTTVLAIAPTLSFGGNAATAEVIPEPTTAALLGLGLTGLAVVGRRRSA